MDQPRKRPLTKLDAIFTRCSVRSYTKEKLDRPTIRALLDAAVRAPTAMRLEPWAFVVIQDDATLKRYSDRAKASWAAELVKYRDLQVAVDEVTRSAFAARLASPDFSVFYDAGTLIVICSRSAGPFAASDCWLAAENLMLAACAMGLGTCCIGSAVPAFNTPEAKAEFGLPSDVTAVAPIIVGVPNGTAAPAARKDPDVLYWK